MFLLCSFVSRFFLGFGLSPHHHHLPRTDVPCPSSDFGRANPSHVTIRSVSVHGFGSTLTPTPRAFFQASAITSQHHRFCTNLHFKSSPLFSIFPSYLSAHHWSSFSVIGFLSACYTACTVSLQPINNCFLISGPRLPRLVLLFVTSHLPLLMPFYNDFANYFA